MNKEDVMRITRDRYYSIATHSEGEIFRDVALLVYHTTSDGLNFHAVEIPADKADSTDIGGLLEEAFHDIVDRTHEKYLDEVAYRIMGAIKEDELDDVLRENEEYTHLDLGYVIPGLIENIRIFKVENEEYPHEYTSSTFGDYSPSHPWDAPGMSIRDFI